MSELLFLPDDLSGTWHTADETLMDAADKRSLAGREMVVILSGQSVRILPHQLPNLRPKEREQAARFAIEPDMAEDVDVLHLSIGETRLAAMSKPKMRSVMSALTEAGVVPTAIYTDYDVLPAATLPDRIIVEGATLDHGFPLGDATPAQMGLGEIAKLANLGEGLNLLGGEFAKSRMPDFAASSGLLKVAASLLACLAISGFALSNATARAERLQVEDLRARASSTYIAATGQASSNPARDVTQFASAPAQVGALDMMSVLFTALKEVDGVSIDQLSYNIEAGELELRLAYPGFSATQDLEAAVARAGGTLRAGGVRETGGRFIGDATLRVGG